MPSANRINQPAASDFASVCRAQKCPNLLLNTTVGVGVRYFLHVLYEVSEGTLHRRDVNLNDLR